MKQIKAQQYLGVRFKRPNKDYTETVVDCYTTYNLKSEIVKQALVATHEMAGSVVTNYETPMSIVQRFKVEETV